MRIKELQRSSKRITISTVVLYVISYPYLEKHYSFDAKTSYESTPDNDRLETEVTAKTKSLVLLYVVGFRSMDCLFIVEGRITDKDCYRNIISQEQGCKRPTH